MLSILCLFTNSLFRHSRLSMCTRGFSHSHTFTQAVILRMFLICHCCLSIHISTISSSYVLYFTWHSAFSLDSEPLHFLSATVFLLIPLPWNFYSPVEISPHSFFSKQHPLTSFCLSSGPNLVPLPCAVIAPWDIISYLRAQSLHTV